MRHALEKSVLVLYIKKGSRILAPYTFTRVFPAFSKKGVQNPSILIAGNTGNAGNAGNVRISSVLTFFKTILMSFL